MPLSKAMLQIWHVTAREVKRSLMIVALLKLQRGPGDRPGTVANLQQTA
jgi:hypothetical protein